MNGTRREPTTGTRCPTLFKKWHGILYMPSRTAGHTKAFIYPFMGHWGGESKCSGTRQIQTADLSVHSGTREPPDHNARPKSEDQLYPGSLRGGGLLPIGGSSVKIPPPRHPQGAIIPCKIIGMDHPMAGNLC